MAYKYEKNQLTKDDEKEMTTRLKTAGEAGFFLGGAGNLSIHRDSWTLWKQLRRNKKKKAYLGGDHLSFGDAFKNIRKKYGPNATFVWHGKEYTTKYKEEK